MLVLVLVVALLLQEVVASKLTFTERRSALGHGGQKFGGGLRSALLPAGYPDTVPAEYATFQSLNLIQDACSYLRSVISTSAVLKGLGVGSNEASATAATLLWFLRDGAGMIGGLLFASLSARRFGQNAKQWRLFADGINNVGITLEVLAPQYSSSKPLFLFLLSAASICRALCGVAAGACNAAISEHMGSKHGNHAEIASKNGAQHTLVSLVCLAVSIPFISFTGRIPGRMLWLIYALLTTTHMVCNYRAMKILALRTLNPNRLSILISRFLSPGSPGHDNHNGLGTADVAVEDPVLFFRGVKTREVRFWANARTLSSLCDPAAIVQALPLYHDLGYFIVPASASSHSSPSSSSPSSRTVVVCIKAAGSASAEQQAKALFEAHLLLRGLRAAASPAEAAKRARVEADAAWGGFWQRLGELGWDRDRLLLQPAFASTVDVKEEE